MKKALFPVFLFISVFFVNAQDTISEKSNMKKTLTQDTGTIYFIRSTGFAGSATAFTAFIDDELVCKLNNKRYLFMKLHQESIFLQYSLLVRKQKKRLNQFQ